MRNKYRDATNASYLVAGLTAATLAAGAVYLFDPASGARRRAFLRDKARRGGHRAGEFIDKASRDARQRARGLYAEIKSRWEPAPSDDRLIEERVRAQLGRLSSHPGAIEVSCSNGSVRLAGHILEAEADTVVGGLDSVTGVQKVLDEMQRHAEPGSIPALQGQPARRPVPTFEYLQENWAPAPRLLAGVAGSAMILGGASSRSVPGAALAIAGGALLARSLFNRPLSQMLGVKAGPEAGVLVQKTIHVYADADEVYSRWRDLESFPKFMSHVREVRKLDENLYHWTVDGPAGVPVEWDARITADARGELIAWRTVEGSPVQSTGVVQFEPSNYGGTRVHVRMSYRPPANVVGHTVASILGRSPKRQLDDDLMRFKNMVELRSWPTHAESGTRH